MEEMNTFVCAVCRHDKDRSELAEEVFNVDGRYVLVSGVPSTVCRRCGERSFSSDTVEKARRLVHGQVGPTKSVPMHVYQFV